MTPRERMLAAIRHQPVDRLPTDIWAVEEVWERLARHYGSRAAALAALGIDGFAGAGAPYIGPALPAAGRDERIDMWGIVTRRLAFGSGSGAGTYQETARHPLAEATTIDDLRAYRWPEADWFDYRAFAERVRALDGRQAVQVGYMAPFYLFGLLVGFERSMTDPVERPEFTAYLLERMGGFLLEHHRRLFAAAGGRIDVAQVTDDLGSQAAPLISLRTYRQVFRPWHQRMADLCHEFNITVFHHDDGAIRPFIPDLLDLGIGILNPVQHECPGMDAAGLKRDFGARVCFHGAVENQRILPFGTPEEVRSEVRKCIDALASDGTGYIVAPCHNLQAMTPLENIVALYDEARRHGREVARRFSPATAAG